ncbi:MAG: lipopolysaccharide heptosyltransferase II [Candidatus Omnitrophica bacterium]|nr:lipopolysaccharide heptosyltransferase II [Candidatus Omnitrophota bacterium]
MNKILIVNPFGIGDVLFTTPLVAALKKAVPEAAIAYIGNARTVPFLKNDPALYKVFSYERDEFVAVYKRAPFAFLKKWRAFVEEIRAEKFDTAFDLSLGSPLGLALAWADIPDRIGYDYRGRGRWLTKRLPLKGYEGRHVAEYYLDLLACVGLMRPADPRMAIVTSSSDDAWAEAFMKAQGLKEQAFIVMYPGGGASWGKGAGLKRWPAGNFAQIADKMIEKAGCPIILMGDQSETALCEDIAAQMRGKPVIAAGQTTITAAAALMKRSRLVIANDGGPLHVAVAAGAKTLSIFGPVDPDVYGPFPKDGHVVVVKRLPCRPCYRNFRMSDCTHASCLKELTVKDVFEQIMEKL